MANNKNGYEFKMSVPFVTRKAQSEKILNMYPDKKPVVIEKSTVSNVLKMDKSRFIINENLTLAHIMKIVRQNISMTETDALYLFIDKGETPSLNKTISELYNKHADRDGFLYITYCSENCFGSHL